MRPQSDAKLTGFRGHYTIEVCPISQYDAHVRAILDLPIPDEGTCFTIPGTNAIMLNILGGAQRDTHLLAAQRAMSVPGARLHMYGKGDARPGRKMGHVTVVADTMSEAERRIEPLIKLVDQIRAERKQPQPKAIPKQGQPQTLNASSTMAEKPSMTEDPLVAITMGSDSDLAVLMPGINLLRELQIPHSVTITSAHRTPQRMLSFAQEAVSRGIKIIIAGAGGAAHLPGMIAALTPLPVIGVPVKASVLDGIDSLLSIVQMPVGYPVSLRLMFRSEH